MKLNFVTQIQLSSYHVNETLEFYGILVKRITLFKFQLINLRSVERGVNVEQKVIVYNNNKGIYVLDKELLVLIYFKGFRPITNEN
jgi:hypothetical protein